LNTTNLKQPCRGRMDTLSRQQFHIPSSRNGNPLSTTVLLAPKYLSKRESVFEPGGESLMGRQVR